MAEHFEIIGSLAFEPIVIPALPEKLPVLNVTLEQFGPMTEIVIDNFEGGYYNPSMLKNFQAKDQAVLKNSGETLFGLDRMAGAQLARYPEWKQFWELIDADRDKNPFAWKYNYKGGSVFGKEAIAPKLKRLAAAIMYQWFSYLAGRYILISSMDEIAADQRLIIHFSYSCWNGESWFEKYSMALNEAIKKYSGQKEAIFNEAIKARTMATNKFGLPNRAIRQQGQHMLELFKKIGLM